MAKRKKGWSPEKSEWAVVSDFELTPLRVVSEKTVDLFDASILLDTNTGRFQIAITHDGDLTSISVNVEGARFETVKDAQGAADLLLKAEFDRLMASV